MQEAQQLTSRRITIDPRFLHTQEVVERPPSERPTQDTVEALAEWLSGPVRSGTPAQSFDELAWRMLAAGLPLLRVSVHVPTLHPEFLGTTFMWWRSTGQTTQTMIAHEVADLIPYEANPVARVCRGGETLRRPLEEDPDLLDFAVLHELREKGATDYFALPIGSGHGVNFMATYVTDRPGGFTDAEMAQLMLLSRRLGSVIDLYSQRWIARNLLIAYLGPKTGPRVLAGQIRRGSGEEIAAVLWSSDLRGFTARSDRLPGDRIIAILNALFDAQAKAIHDHGGEILKFIGDGLLAIFPIDRPDLAAAAAHDALHAAFQAVAAVEQLSQAPLLDTEPPLQIVVALHIGTVIYGNIGAAGRLDFTVIGPAVNLVTRVEAIAKSMDLPIVVTDDFARAYTGLLRPLGRHQLRGLADPHDLYAPAPPTEAGILPPGEGTEVGERARAG